MEQEQTNQVSIPKSILRQVKVYAAHNDMKIKAVVADALLYYLDAMSNNSSNK